MTNTLVTSTVMQPKKVLFRWWKYWRFSLFPTYFHMFLHSLLTLSLIFGLWNVSFSVSIIYLILSSNSSFCQMGHIGGYSYFKGQLRHRTRHPLPFFLRAPPLFSWHFLLRFSLMSFPTHYLFDCLPVGSVVSFSSPPLGPTSYQIISTISANFFSLFLRFLLSPLLIIHSNILDTIWKHTLKFLQFIMHNMLKDLWDSHSIIEI